MSYFEAALEQLEFDLSPNPDKNPWLNERRLEMLRELLPKFSASEVAKAINVETGSDLTRNAVIGKACRIGLKMHVAKPIRKPSIANPRPKTRKLRKVLKIASIAVSEPFADEVRPLDMKPMGYFDEWPNDRCRWPVGSPKSPDFYFCGAEGCDVAGGKSWCSFHERMVYARRAA